MSEICGICEIQNDDVFDGLCEKCEPLWLNELSRLSKDLLGDTPLKNLFQMAVIEAKKI